ncbi:MAG: hypothetical protein WC551_07795 [Patescibacteria group bacterium]
MTITAKYSGKCSVCGGHICAGETIEWKKGQPARHPGCKGTRKPAKAAPLVAAAKVKEELAALKAELATLVASDENRVDGEPPCPEGARYVLREGAHGSGQEIYVLSSDGRVSLWYSGCYDDYRSCLWTTTSARAVQIFTELTGGSSGIVVEYYRQ